MDFDPNGPGEYVHALQNIDSTLAILLEDIEARVHAITEQLFPGSRVDNDADAFRHALLSFELAKELGITDAKAFGDAHERDGSIDPDNVMDLFNNKVGRDLFAQNPDGDPVALALFALDQGRLLTSPPTD